MQSTEGNLNMNDKPDNAVSYRNISLLVRPARVAILIYEKDEYWKHIMLQVFEWCSRVWGGAYFLIVPTDGKEIKAPFWSILEEYSPDHVFSFLPTFQDLEYADPQKYTSIITQYKEDLIKKIPELSDKPFLVPVSPDITSNMRCEFEIDDELQQLIIGLTQLNRE